MQACWGAPRGKAVCHNSQSAALLSDSGLVMYFSTLPAPSSSAPCILAILTHLRGCIQNVHFDTPSTSESHRPDEPTTSEGSRFVQCFSQGGHGREEQVSAGLE